MLVFRLFSTEFSYGWEKVKNVGGPNVEQIIAFLMKLIFRVKPNNDLLRQKCKIIELFFRPGRSGRPSLWSACLVRFSG